MNLAANAAAPQAASGSGSGRGNVATNTQAPVATATTADTEVANVAANPQPVTLATAPQTQRRIRPNGIDTAEDRRTDTLANPQVAAQAIQTQTQTQTRRRVLSEASRKFLEAYSKSAHTRRAVEAARKAQREQQQQGMGNRSQIRITQAQRNLRLKAKAAIQNRKVTLKSRDDFDPNKHCIRCISIKESKLTGKPVTHKGHHKLCWNNSRAQKIAGFPLSLEDRKRNRELYQKNNQKLRGCNTVDPNFFTRPYKIRKKNPNSSSTNNTNTATNTATNMSTANTNTKTNDDEYIQPEELMKGTIATMGNSKEMDKHKGAKCPKAMLAFAHFASKEKMLTRKKVAASYFDGLTMTAPDCEGSHTNPHYHSIVGQKLLLVDWIATHGLTLRCFNPKCGKQDMKNHRTNFSQNCLLFPTFGIEGAPSWCMVQTMICPRCKFSISANHPDVLLRLPDYAALSHPVEPKWAIPGAKSHLARSATDVFDRLMVTHLGGTMCSELLYSAVNRAYMERIRSYYSSFPDGSDAPDYICKKTEYVKRYPPQGDTIGGMYDKASNSDNNPWLVSDKMRHNRETQGVNCGKKFVIDHTHDMTRNYYNRKTLKAKACFTTGVETNEIACPVMVPSTRTEDFSHAATQMSNGPWFKPKVHYSDIYPNNEMYWKAVFGEELEGRLGLFHFEQRIIKTLDSRNPQYGEAIRDLLDCMYEYWKDDIEAVYAALRKGTLGGHVHTDSQINELRNTKRFRDNYDKYLRKVTRPGNQISVMLQRWFEKYEEEEPEDNRCKACGRNEPTNTPPLFCKATKQAVHNCKIKAECLQDPFPLEQMYDAIPPSPRSKSQLTVYLSRRGESNLENFHLLLAHFANGGMDDSLADNLNLTGTSRYNLRIRHKLRLANAPMSERGKEPAGWEMVVDYWNHSELNYVNEMARRKGAKNVPFAEAEKLVEDTGERFFSEYLKWLNENKVLGRWGLCGCDSCGAILRARTDARLAEERARNNNNNNNDQQQQQQQQPPPPPPPPPVDPTITHPAGAAAAEPPVPPVPPVPPPQPPSPPTQNTDNSVVPILPRPPPIEPRPQPVQPRQQIGATAARAGMAAARARNQQQMVLLMQQQQMMMFQQMQQQQHTMNNNQNPLLVPRNGHPQGFQIGYGATFQNLNCCPRWVQYRSENNRGRPPNNAHDSWCPNHNKNKKKNNSTLTDV